MQIFGHEYTPHGIDSHSKIYSSTVRSELGYQLWRYQCYAPHGNWVVEPRHSQLRAIYRRRNSSSGANDLRWTWKLEHAAVV